MSSTLIFGLILFGGFAGGEFAKWLKLPKVTGYIIAGIILNPGVTGIVPDGFTDNLTVLTNIALSFITFSVGGSLLWQTVKKLGKGIVYITVLEAELAFLFAAAGIAAALFYTGSSLSGESSFLLFPAALLLASLASPTDPSATLAVKNEYNAKGEVMDTVMGVAAFDDVLGIINYSLATAVALALITHAPVSFMTVAEPLYAIAGAVLLGVLFGLAFNIITRWVKKEGDSVWLVIIMGILLTAFGVSTLLKVDELLATMSVGVVVVNFNPRQKEIFQVLERYTDEIIFTLFFTISGLNLNFASLASGYWLIGAFVLSRFLGKAGGVYLGGTLAKSSPEVKKYTTGALLPQGGIVIGLALMMSKNDAFAPFADLVLNVILGATVIHELSGPVITRISLSKAGEIKR